MAHKAIPYGEQAACPSNVVAFTNYPMVGDITQIRKTHIDQLRAAVAGERTRRERDQTTWTDPTIEASKTLPRKPHMSEARDSIEDIRDPSVFPARVCETNVDGCVCEAHVILTDLGGPTGDQYCTFCQDYCTTNTQGYCPTDASAAITWTDPEIVANEMHVRAIHMNEVMEDINIQSQQCVCEQETCNYCADCGYSYRRWYTACSHAGCACNDHKYNECQHSTYWVNSPVNACSVVDSAESDYRTALAAYLPPGIDTPDQVPWNCMCSYTPPGINWVDRKGHAAWGCMCNPFLWLGGLT